MIKQASETVLMKGKGSTLEAMERVCDKRSLKGATTREIIQYLSDLRDKYHANRSLCEGIDTLKSYWIARKG